MLIVQYPIQFNRPPRSISNKLVIPSILLFITYPCLALLYACEWWLTNTTRIALHALVLPSKYC